MDEFEAMQEFAVRTAALDQAVKFAKSQSRSHTTHEVTLYARKFYEFLIGGE